MAAPHEHQPASSLIPHPSSQTTPHDPGEVASPLQATIPSGSFPVPSATPQATAGPNSARLAPVPSRSSNQPAENCVGRTSAGQPCRAFPLHGSTFCAFHDPHYRPRLLDSASRGGRGKRSTALPLPEQPLDLSTRKGIQDALGYVLNLQIAGRLSQHQSRQLTRLVATAERALDPDAPEDDLSALFREFSSATLARSNRP